MTMVGDDVLEIRLKNPYGDYSYAIDVNSLYVAEKIEAIRDELEANGWFFTEKIRDVVTKGLYLMAIEGFN